MGLAGFLCRGKILGRWRMRFERFWRMGICGRNWWRGGRKEFEGFTIGQLFIRLINDCWRGNDRTALTALPPNNQHFRSLTQLIIAKGYWNRRGRREEAILLLFPMFSLCDLGDLRGSIAWSGIPKAKELERRSKMLGA